MATIVPADIPQHLRQTPRHEYRPLDRHREEIRVLHLNAAVPSEEGNVTCSMQHVSLQEDPPYETISYVWGYPGIRSFILVDGLVLDVPASSEQVLRSMRHEHATRTLWIDAVCINQDADIAEKSHQVASMDKIYAKASQNLIYLGYIDSEEQAIRAALDAVLQDARLETDNFSRFLATLKDLATGRQLFAHQGFSVPIDFTALLPLYSSAWSSRLWVVQEVSLAKGSLSYYECNAASSTAEGIAAQGSVKERKSGTPIEMCDILRAARWLRYKQAYLPASFRFNKGNHFMGASIIWHYADAEHGVYNSHSPWKPDVSDMLQDLRPFGAFNPLDHLFGIQGLLRKYEPLRSIPAPDYHRPLPEVMQDATRAVLDARSNLDFFRMLHQRPPKADGEDAVPSWVARWDVGWSVAVDFEHQYLHHRCHGERDCLQSPVPPPDPAVLSASGIEIDTINKLLITVGREGSIAPGAMLDVIDRLMTEQPTSLLGYTDRRSAIAMTLIAASDHFEQPVGPVVALERFDAWQTFLAHENTLPPRLGALRANPDAHTEALLKAAEYYEAFIPACSKGTLFLTHAGQLGIGPQTLEASDVVAVLFGCKWPVVLRSSTKSSEYRDVGVCYIHGVMQGEFVQRHARSGEADKVFHLL